MGQGARRVDGREGDICLRSDRSGLTVWLAGEGAAESLVSKCLTSFFGAERTVSGRWNSRSEEDAVGRKIADCQDFPSESGCTLTISGEEDEVVNAATQHAVSVHGHEDAAEVRDWLRENLKDEVASI